MDRVLSVSLEITEVIPGGLFLMALQKKRVRRTIVAGVEIESAEEENLVTEAAK